MKDKRCFICKYQGKIELDTYANEIYGQRDKNLSILLCYTHSIELFKTGQIKFMAKYKPNFSQFYGVENDQAALNFFAPRN